MNTILQQGNLDGMCLLYSIMNAYKVLTQDKMTSHEFTVKAFGAWKKIVSSLPWPQNFLNGAGTNFRESLSASDNITMEEAIIRRTLTILNHGEAKKVVFSKISVSTKIDLFDEIISSNVTGQSVLIFVVSKFNITSVGKKELIDISHWLCAVDSTDTETLLACSFAPVMGAVEQESSRLKRPYNNKMYIADFNNANIELTSLYKLYLKAL